MTRMSRFLKRLMGTPTLLVLSEAQRRTLMTWGMLGGMIALTVVLLWIVLMVDGHFDRHGLGQVQVAIVGGLFDVAYAVIALSALLAVGMVAIARGGSMEAKLSRDGVSISLSAEGAAAAKAAMQLGTIAIPPAPPAPPARPESDKAPTEKPA